ncbi:response regulator [Shewanella eurypsychrophilus]|uniref:histidine kinase n=1 Tax=Shewanella eurypsychrophilus TaxID=2593656 RepID=A0ABX6V4T4_9GAMM|nr:MULTISPECIES: PAS domain-containing hybrid sensor histidine kinase/response regulator [Shewanella]QFU21563.1 response regulator [Shewanella sp. YLB-09]QPG56853.1 response regulator [Shewanella eurypsychrophilus]
MYQQSPLNLTPFPILACNKLGGITGTNSCFRNTFEVTSNNFNEMMAHTLFNFFDIGLTSCQPLFLEHLNNKENFLSYLVINTKKFSVSVTINLNPDDPNEYWLLVNPCCESQIQASLVKNKLHRLNHAIKGADIGTWEYTPETELSYFSLKLKELVGIKADTPLSWHQFKALVIEKDRANFEQLTQQECKPGTRLCFEFRLNKAGKTCWFKLNSEAFLSDGEKFTITGSLIDCTEEKENILALRNAIESKNLALEAGNIGNWRAELDENQQWAWDWDARANDMFALNPTDIGHLQKWVDRLHPEDSAGVLAAVQHSLNTGDNFDKQYRTTLPSGEIKYVLGKGKVGRDKLNKISRIDGVCIDQSPVFEAQNELQKINDELEARVNLRTLELQHAKEKAEQANQTKSEFLSMMSHELRTPMNAVLGSLDLLTLSRQSPESTELIETAATSASNLVTILNDILDITKIESGKLQLEERDYSVAEAIDNVIKIFLPVAIKKGVSLSVEEDPSIPLFLEGDVLRVRQVLFNLLGNAIKFTASTNDNKGEVKLKSEVIDHNNTVYKIAFTISDNGIGIDKDTQKKLFTPFTQAQRSTTRKYGGTGLGLAICGKLVNLMGGTIKLSSTLGEGSSFRVELPFLHSKKADEHYQLSSAKVALIQLCDHQDRQLNNITNHLRTEKCQLTHYEVSKIDSAIAENDAVLLLCCNLPPHKQALLSIYQAHQLASNLLIGVQSAQISQLRTLMPQSLLLSIDPLTRNQLVTSIKKLIDQEICLALDELDTDDLVVNVMDDTRVNQQADILVVEDNPLNQKLIEKQLAALGYRCDLADDGLDGIEKWQTTDYKIILTDCHMPNLDGYNMTKKIRDMEQQDQKQAIPIVAITGAAMSGDAEYCYSTGMNDFVSKPIILKDLKKVMKKWYLDS